MSESPSLKTELERFPYEVGRSERGAYFDGLVERWPLPELVQGIAQWRSDCLLPFLEAAQGSRALADAGHRDIASVVWLDPIAAWDDDERDVTLEEIASLGAATKVVDELPEGLTVERFEALSRSLEGADAVLSPLTAFRSQALDLLLARLMGLRVALVVPDPLSRAMGEAGTMPQLMTVAQTATVIVVPLTTNLTFWTMAAHADLVDAERAGHGVDRQRAVLAALADPQRAVRRTEPKLQRAADPIAPLVGASLGVAAGLAKLKFPPIISSGEGAQPVNDVPLDAETLRRRIASLKRQLLEAEEALQELEG